MSIEFYIFQSHHFETAKNKAYTICCAYCYFPANKLLSTNPSDDGRYVSESREENEMEKM